MMASPEEGDGNEHAVTRSDTGPDNYAGAVTSRASPALCRAVPWGRTRTRDLRPLANVDSPFQGERSFLSNAWLPGEELWVRIRP